MDLRLALRDAFFISKSKSFILRRKTVKNSLRKIILLLACILSLMLCFAACDKLVPGDSIGQSGTLGNQGGDTGSGNNDSGNNDSGNNDSGNKHTHTPAPAVRENEKAATCIQEGSYDEVIYCSDKTCKSEISRVTKTIEKTAHTPAAAVRENEVEATCTDDGNYEEVVYCKNCEYEFSRETKRINATGQHNYVDLICTVCNGKKQSEGLQFASNGDGTCYVSEIGNCTDTNIVIPVTSPKGNTVMGIGDNAFRSCWALESVVIPDSVTSIGEYAFYNCSALKSIVIPDGVTDIGSWAFSYCSALTSIDIPNSVTSIGEYAFYDCSVLTSIEMPDSIISIGDNVFSSCSALKSIVIPDGVTDIGSWAFSYCSTLTSIDIPNSVTSIGDNAFSGCSALTSIRMPDSIISIGDNMFSGCLALVSIEVAENNIAYKSVDGSLYTKDGKALIQYAIGKTNTSFAIPDGVTRIGSHAFSGCLALASIDIPNSITSIGSHAFSVCSALTSIDIPDSVTEIGKYAFSGCSALVSIDIPNSVTSIGDNVFSSCSALKGIVIPDGVTIIGDNAFEDCTSLTSIEIPNSVTSIGDNAFSRCSALGNIEVAENNIAYKSVDGNLYTKDGKALIQYAIGKTNTSFAIPDGVTRIGSWTFFDCSALESIVIGDSVTSIGDLAFYYFSSLKEVYYTGSEEEWAKISIGRYNDELRYATRYYYSETAPTDDGNYWHYGESGEIVIWE